MTKLSDDEQLSKLVKAGARGAVEKRHAKMYPKLLTEEELIAEIDVITDNLLANGIAAKGVYDDKILALIQSQKQAHADMVIGEDEQQLENLTGVDHDRFTRNRLRAKQRERNKTT
ncbi:hypothetical protein [Mycolicibacterium porcinum]|uniref:hypothetical protein n=1 Tax=Mycolicibacterium porcinum TaxID=39693 RepID=UPI001041BEE8|nr:hypothetical protein [Mycolicibacterium porcinum]